MPHISGFKIDGEIAPSVTEITGLIQKPWKETWQRKVGFEESDRIMNAAASLGQEAHDMVDEFLMKGTLSTCSRSEAARKLFDAWFKWWQEAGYKLIVSEKHLVSIKHRYHGSVDCILQSPKGLVIADWKFSKSEDPMRLLQLVGYVVPYFEETKEKINVGMIVRIDPKTFKVHETHYDNLWKWTKVFITLRVVYDLSRGIIKNGSKRTAKAA